MQCKTRKKRTTFNSLPKHKIDQRRHFVFADNCTKSHTKMNSTIMTLGPSLRRKKGLLVYPFKPLPAVTSMIVESSWNVSCPSVLNRQQFPRVLHVMPSNGYASKMQTSKSSAFLIRGFFRIKKINCSILSIKQLSYNPRSQKTE